MLKYITKNIYQCKSGCALQRICCYIGVLATHVIRFYLILVQPMVSCWLQRQNRLELFCKIGIEKLQLAWTFPNIIARHPEARVVAISLLYIVQN